MKHSDYTVGWVCALPTEKAAAVGMLDKRHVQLPQPSHDQNVYTLGCIGSHNVAIACLPAGVTGTTSAAIVATQMLSTFTSIRFGLMVGIGGGVPSQEYNIRLGDVVVGKPSGTSPGVIQYDFGKTVQEGRFAGTGSLNRPPNVVLNAVTSLQAKHMMEDSELSKHLSEIVSNYPKLRTTATYQGIEHDVLFEAEYDHQEGDVACTHCDVDRQVDRQTFRPARNGTDPAIHYGLIASGNQVMRNGSCRERLRRELNVLCFEMEAAGLMDNFPCLVIRGICDYADSHKNKRWQAYAAATAAAYAKELLYIIPQSRVMETRLVAEEIKETPTPSEYTGPPSEQYHLHHTQSGKNPIVHKTTAQMSALTSSIEPQVGHRSLAHSKTIRHPRTKIWTYRLEKLPTTVTRDTVQNLFEVDGTIHLRIRSLVPVVDSVSETRTQTATMEYLSPSGDAPECLDRKIVITRDFHGFTPLNNPLEPISAELALFSAWDCGVMLRSPLVLSLLPDLLATLLAHGLFLLMSCGCETFCQSTFQTPESSPTAMAQSCKEAFREASLLVTMPPFGKN
jgi:nucleoside phosphorylase